MGFWDVPKTVHHGEHPAPTEPQISKNRELEAGRDGAAPEPSMGLLPLLLERMDLEQRRGDGDVILGCLPHTAQGAPQRAPVATQPQHLPKMGAGRGGAEPVMDLLQLLHEASKGQELRPSRKGWIWSREEVMRRWFWDALHTLHQRGHPVPTQPQNLPKKGAGRDGAAPEPSMKTWSIHGTFLACRGGVRKVEMGSCWGFQGCRPLPASLCPSQTTRDPKVVPVPPYQVRLPLHRLSSAQWSHS